MQHCNSDHANANCWTLTIGCPASFASFLCLSSALLALKRRRYQEQLLSRTQAQMLNLEELVHSIQFASLQSQVFAALHEGNDVLRALNNETRLEDVEQLMDETREAVAYQQQVADLLGSTLTHEDEADVEQTIRQWEQEEQEERMAEQVDAMPRADEQQQQQQAAEATKKEVDATSTHSVAPQQDKSKQLVTA